MKDFLKIAALICVLILFSVLGAVFEPRDEYAKERDAAQEENINHYEEGMSYAQNRIANHLDFEFSDLEYEIKDEYGISPEEALRILENYVDEEPITEDELENAIWAIRSYYHKSQDVINEIDDYWIE